MIANLFKIEFIKIFYSRSFQIVTLFSILTLLLVKMRLSSPSSSVESLLILIKTFAQGLGAFISLVFFVMITSISISNTCGEFSSNMFKQQIMLGGSRIQLVASPAISNLIYSLYYTFLFLFLMLLFGFKGIPFLVPVFLSSFFVLNFATTFSFIFKKTGLSIALFLGYFLILEFIIFGFFINGMKDGIDVLKAFQFTSKSFILLFIEPIWDLSGREVIDVDWSRAPILNPYLTYSIHMVLMFLIQYRLIKNKSF